MKIEKEKIVNVLEKEQKHYKMLMGLWLSDDSVNLEDYKRVCEIYTKIDSIIYIIKKDNEDLKVLLLGFLVSALKDDDFRLKDIVLKTLNTIEL